eukprot:SAG11_NODE_1399_length_5020_cov_3.398293_2_plen_97_part_00
MLYSYVTSICETQVLNGRGGTSPQGNSSRCTYTNILVQRYYQIGIYPYEVLSTYVADLVHTCTSYSCTCRSVRLLIPEYLQLVGLVVGKNYDYRTF